VPSEASIDRFWQQFAKLATGLERDLADEGALASLERSVSALGPYDWEVGPSGVQGRALALSPRGDPDLLVETRAVVGRAPPRAGWVYLPALPPKEWTGQLVWGTGVAKRVLQTAAWHAVLYEYPDGKVEIDVHDPELDALTPEDAESAARLAVVSWIGEELVIERVLDVKSVPTRSQARGILLRSLREVLSSAGSQSV